MSTFKFNRAKHVVDLNGTWDFVADLDPKYHAIHGGFHQPDADRRHWLKVPVPGVWQKIGERYDIFEGVGWFAREFEIDDLPDNAMARLRFGAVNYLANVYLNGEKVGGHEGGYTEFVLDVTGNLKPGRNHIAVQVDNRATSIQWPPCLGYFNYGGIHRDVTLEILDGPCLEDVRLQTEFEGGKDRLVVSGFVARGSLDSLHVEVDVAGTTGESAVDSDGRFSIEVSLLEIMSWSPDTPKLHRVTVKLTASKNPAESCLHHGREGGGRRLEAPPTLGNCRAEAPSPSKRCPTLDWQEFACGFRTVEMRDGRVHLNGSPLTLRGICYVYDSPTHGLVMTPEQVEADVRLMKELGCNAVRCHYPMDERFYAACDRAGLLVWIEPNVYCYSPPNDETDTLFARAESRAAAERMIVEMIAVARHHPSVVIYGIGNECNTSHPEAEPFFRRLAVRIREIDPTRLVSYAALYGDIGPLADIVDVLGINSYWGWYDRIWGGKGLEPDADSAPESIDLMPMREMLDEALDKNRGTALLLTEFGADSVAGFHSDRRALWSEEYHAHLLREIFALASEYPQIAGTFPFCFSDYRDPSKVHNGYWNEFNLKGLVTYERKKKAAFRTVRDTYTGEADG